MNNTEKIVREEIERMTGILTDSRRRNIFEDTNFRLKELSGLNEAKQEMESYNIGIDYANLLFSGKVKEGPEEYFERRIKEKGFVIKEEEEVLNEFFGQAWKDLKRGFSSGAKEVVDTAKHVKNSITASAGKDAAGVNYGGALERGAAKTTIATAKGAVAVAGTIKKYYTKFSDMWDKFGGAIASKSLEIGKKFGVEGAVQKVVDGFKWVRKHRGKIMLVLMLISLCLTTFGSGSAAMAPFIHAYGGFLAKAKMVSKVISLSDPMSFLTQSVGQFIEHIPEIKEYGKHALEQTKQAAEHVKNFLQDNLGIVPSAAGTTTDLAQVFGKQLGPQLEVKGLNFLGKTAAEAAKFDAVQKSMEVLPGVGEQTAKVAAKAGNVISDVGKNLKNELDLQKKIASFTPKVIKDLGLDRITIDKLETARDNMRTGLINLPPDEAKEHKSIIRSVFDKIKEKVAEHKAEDLASSSNAAKIAAKSQEVVNATWTADDKAIRFAMQLNDTNRDGAIAILKAQKEAAIEAAKQAALEKLDPLAGP
jgi:hypothetical protein